MCNTPGRGDPGCAIVRTLAPKYVAGLGGHLECQSCGSGGATFRDIRHKNCFIQTISLISLRDGVILENLFRGENARVDRQFIHATIEKALQVAATEAKRSIPVSRLNAPLRVVVERTRRWWT